MKKTSLTNLRKNLFLQVDQVISTGSPLIIERNNNLIKLSLIKKKPYKLTNLRAHKTTLDTSKSPLKDTEIYTWNEPQNL